MDLEEYGRAQRRMSNPQCVFCEVMTEPSVIYQSQGLTVRGWRCPKCGFAFLHPEEIPKAMQVMREVARVY